MFANVKKTTKRATSIVVNKFFGSQVKNDMMRLMSMMRSNSREQKSPIYAMSWNYFAFTRDGHQLSIFSYDDDLKVWSGHTFGVDYINSMKDNFREFNSSERKKLEKAAKILSSKRFNTCTDPNKKLEDWVSVH